MSDEKKLPKRRFKEFLNTPSWEQRKLGEVAKVEMDKRIYKEQTTAEGEIPFYKIGTFGGKADSYISEELYNEYTQKYSHPKEGDILISASGSIGRTVVYHGEKAYFQDSNIVWLNHKGALDNGFLLQFYSRVQWAGLEGSTIKRLYNKNILETEINVPNIEEQKNIGKFFTQVDNLITLHQRKLNKLENLKKAYLEELFPDGKQCKPKRRFKEFKEDWEQRKLGELVEMISGDAPSIFTTGDNIYIKVDDLNYSDRVQISASNMVDINPKAHLVSKGATIFPKRGAAIMTNKVRIMGVDGYLDTNMMALIPDNIDKKFLFTFIQKTGLYKIADTSTIPQINNKHIEPYLIQVPSIKEQTYIGVIFEKLDNLITLHQHK